MKDKIDELRALLAKHHADFYRRWPTGEYNTDGGPAWMYQRDLGRMEGIEDSIAILTDK